MRKKIALLLCAFILATGTSRIVFAESTEPEPIEYGLNYILERLYDNKTIECVPLDISAQANMGFADEVEGDGVGGWTDQGSNDMASFNLFGNQKFLNIPFNIINPDENNGKSCIILRGQNNMAFPLYADVPVNDNAYGIYVLHSTAYGTGDKAGRYTFYYEDGTAAYFDIVGDQHIRNFWGVLNNNFTRTIWKGSNGVTSNIALNIFALNNPHPEKTIKFIRFESDGAVQFINIVAVTLAKELPIFPMIPSASNASSGVIKYGIDTWTTSSAVDETKAVGGLLDVSSYLDAPAGKHGSLAVSGEKFVFQDGTNAKFWGTNIVGEACYPDKSTAENMASKLAREGFNLVRFTNMDTGELNDERLDRLAYFQSLLKQNGIYTYFSLLGNTPGDGKDLCDGWKIDGLFRDDLIEKQIEFAKKLLSYQNKYTGTTFAKDPSLVMIDMADQNSMYDIEGNYSAINVNDEESKQVIKQKFNKYLKDKYKTTKNLAKSWKDLLPYESIEDGSVVFTNYWRYGIFDKARKNDYIEFFAKVQLDYYDRLNKLIKSLGYKGITSGVTNKWNNISMLNSMANAKTDFVPVNMMFAMAIDRTNEWPYLTKFKDYTYFVDSDTTVSSDGHDGKSLINLVGARIDGKPFVVSEWGAANISRLPCENNIVMAAVAAQQGWTPIKYCFVYDKINDSRLDDAYSTYSNPVENALSYATSVLYYSMDELESKDIIIRNNQDVYSETKNNAVISQYLKNQTTNKVTNGKSTPKKITKNEFVIDNGGIYWDMIDGVFFAKTDKVIAFSGNTAHTEKCGMLEMEIYTSEATVALVSLDDKKLENSDRLLLTVASDVANKGTVYRTKYIITSIGEKGIAYNPLGGRIVINNRADYDVYALNQNGERLEKITAEKNDKGNTEFYLSGSLNYELVRR